ncbi:MAG: NADPH-dependent oxidoreductase [Flavipsychrobacter sp.]|jgi:NAD(P)H-dependent FMN reductase|nr:NADPH-dependent oxidoreductase [Flavipsychrobacter sp.]
MITIISGTNRNDSMTLRLANIYYKLLSERTDNVHLLSLEGKQVWERGAEMKVIEHDLLIPAQKFVILMPEYNASFPGILKLMMDNCDVRKAWWYKKAALVGLSDGRAGNIRGLEHMTGILHYLKVHVLYNKLLLSKVNDEMDKNGVLLKPATEKLIIEQVEDFLKF